MNPEMQSEIVKSSLKASPPVYVAVMEAVTGNIDKIMLLVTLIYTALMLVHLVYRFSWDIIDRRRQERDRAEAKQSKTTGCENDQT